MYEFASATVNGEVFVFGGFQFLQVNPFKNIYRFNQAGEWSLLDYEVPNWRFSFRAVSSGSFSVVNQLLSNLGNKIFLIGGQNEKPLQCWRWNKDETFDFWESEYITNWWNTYAETFVVGADEYNWDS